MALKLGFDIENLPPAKKKLLLVLPPVTIVVLFVVFLIMPFFEERGRLVLEVEKQNNEIQTAQKNAAKLSALVAENERLKNKLLELQMRLPEEKEVSGLLKQVSKLGIKSGLQIVSWKPRAKVVHPSNEVYEIPVDVEMRGNYHRFGQFFSNITKLTRVVNISNINMKLGDQKQKAAGLNVSFTAMTYSIIPEKERQELEKAAKEKKKISAALPQKQTLPEAAKKEDTVKKTPEPKTWVWVEYTAGTRRDPFIPLIVRADTKQKKGLVPIESYEASEFKLIAILWDKTKYYAVITLPDGKSYTIREGMKLGLHGGKVYKITKDSVIIREKVRDYRGVLSPKDTILKLRREEEE